VSLLAVVVVGVACAPRAPGGAGVVAAVDPGPAPAPAPASAVAPDAGDAGVAGAMPADARPGPTPFAALQQVLDDHGLVRLTVVDHHCGDDVRIVSGEDARGGGATCHGAVGAMPVCGQLAGFDPRHLGDVVCRHPEALRPTATPPWAAAVATAVGDDRSVTSVSDAGLPALFVADEERAALLVRAADGWRAVDLGDGDGWGRPQVTGVIAGGRLGTEPLIGVEIDRYDGGSETGQEWADLYVVAVGARVALIDTVPVARMRWILPAEKRAAAGPRAAGDRRARPHVEVALASSFDREGRLVLTVARRHLLADLPARQRDWFRCDPDHGDELADDPAASAAACRSSSGGLPDLEALIARVGRWRLTTDGVQRDAAP
jgi:hypothetical protein